jgi:DNA-binding beta-propeller fold protein YncE
MDAKHIQKENDTIILPGKIDNNEVILPNPAYWSLTPAGEQIEVGDLPLGMDISPDGKYIAVTNNGWGEQSFQLIDTAVNKVTDKAIVDKSFYGIAFSYDSKKLYVSGGANNEIYVYNIVNGKLIKNDTIKLGEEKERIFPCGIKASKNGKELYVANLLESTFEIVDLDKKNIKTKIKLVNAKNKWVVNATDSIVSSFPYDIAISENGLKAYVSNWGENSISVLDLKSNKVLKL